MKLTFLLALLAAFSAGVHAEENRYGTYRFDFPLERPLVAFACGKVPFVDPDVMCDEIREVRATGARDIGFFCLTEYAPYMLKCLREGPLADR